MALTRVKKGMIEGANPKVLDVTQYPGADIWARIQAAHDDLDAEGGILDASDVGSNFSGPGPTFSKPLHIILPPNRVTLTSKIHLTRPNGAALVPAGADDLTFEGQGTRLTILEAAGTVSPIIDIEGPFDVMFRNLRVKYTSGDAGSVMIDTRPNGDPNNPWVLRPKFDNVVLEGFEDNGIGLRLSKCYVSSVFRLHIFGFNEGIHSKDDGQFLASNANFTKHTRIYSNNIGIRYADMGSNWLDNVTIEGNKQYGMRLAKGAMIAVSNTYFEQRPDDGALANVLIDGIDDTFARTYDFLNVFWAGFDGTQLAQQKKDIVLGAGKFQHVRVRGGMLNSGVNIGAGQPMAILDTIEFGANSGPVFRQRTTDAALIWDGGELVFTEIDVDDISQANPGVVTYIGTDPKEGQDVYIYGVVGMTEVNVIANFKVANLNTGAKTFELHDADDVPVDTTGFTAYGSGGTIRWAVSVDVGTVIQIQNWLRIDLLNKLAIQVTAKDTAAVNISPFDSVFIADPDADSAAIFSASRSLMSTVDGSTADFTGALFSRNARAVHEGDGDVLLLASDIIQVENHGSGQVTNGVGTYYKTPINDGGGTYGSYYHILVEPPGTGRYLIFGNGGRCIFNALGDADSDFVVIGDNDNPIINVDVSANAISIGDYLPLAMLHVYGSFLYRHLVVVDADGRTINAAESGSVFTNTGAGAIDPFVLPPAAANLTFTFIVDHANGIRVTADAGDTIRIGAGVSGAGGKIESTTVGDAVKLTAIDGTKWIAEYFSAGWVAT